MSYTEFTNPSSKGFDLDTQANKGYKADATTQQNLKEGASNYAYKILEPNILFSKKEKIGKILFPYGMSNSKDIDFSINEVSGYISYFNKEKIYAEKAPSKKLLPQTEEKATSIAFEFMEEKYKRFEKDELFLEKFIIRNKENINIKFNLLPNPKWLIHVQTLAVKNPHTSTLDHWLVKYVIEIETPNKKKYPVLYASIDIRIGASISKMEGYEIIGYVQKWRPMYECFKVEQYLSDTAEPTEEEEDEHGDTTTTPHLMSEIRLSYILSDENYMQNNLLLYEVETDGHHSSVMPASIMSIWVDFAYEDNKLVALIQGTSSNIEVNGISFSYFELDDDLNLIPSNKDEVINLQPFPNSLNKNIFKVIFEGNPFGKEIVLKVIDTDFNNIFLKHISLNMVIPPPPEKPIV